MSMVGRPRVPDEEKKRKGTFRKDRAHEPIQFTTLAKVPDAPALLNEIGKQVWKDVCKELISLKLLQTVDLNLLGILCLEMQHYHTCQNHIAENGHMVPKEGKFGVYMVPNPMVHSANGHLKNLLSIASQFGLTPNARMKLKIGPKEVKKNKALELIAG
jgi:P27 family predicted phage terminase small subunit